MEIFLTIAYVSYAPFVAFTLMKSKYYISLQCMSSSLEKYLHTILMYDFNVIVCFGGMGWGGGGTETFNYGVIRMPLYT